MKNNILIISESLTSGGAERIAANLASNLSKNNNVKLLILNNEVKTYDTDVEILEINLAAPKGIVSKIFWYVKAIKIISKYKRENEINCSISFLNKPDLLNVLTKKRDKTIVSVRNKRSSLNKNIFTKLKDKFIFAKADKIVSLSEGTKLDLMNFYKVKKEKIEVVYNPCDVEIIRNKKKNTPINAMKLNLKNKKNVITAGRLNHQKGQWHLIRAFSKVVKKIPEAQLFMLGQGKERSYLENIIQGLNLQNNVILLGYQSNPYYYLSKCDLFVFSSIYEGFGNILLEAMACELPIISTDCEYGPRELLAPNTSYDNCVTNEVDECENGILVPIFDGIHYKAGDSLTKEENIMADEIIKVLTNEKILDYYKNRSIERIKDFNSKKITEQWENIINNL